MGSQAGAADWEHVVGRDLVPHLLPAAQLGRVDRPAAVESLPEGAYQAIVASVGRVGLEDLLVGPAVAWPTGWSRRRCLYSPPWAAGIGERGVGLWVRALPAPGVRVRVPFGDIAAVEQHGDGLRRVLVVTGRAGSLPVRYYADGQTAVDAWTRRLRLRAAAEPAPIPPPYPGVQGLPGGDPESLLLAPGDAIVSAGWRSRAGRGACLLGVTSRELVVMQSRRAHLRPWQLTTRALYVPRGSVEDAAVRSKAVLLRCAGADVRVVLRSRKVAAAVSSWLRWMLSDHDCSGTGSRPATPGGA
jgi:hypothetical protein